jgi:tetratricopeptide (TPR) repeat protein
MLGIPAPYAFPPAQVRAWHERQAAAAEGAQEWAAALPHLDARLAANPAQAGLRYRRAKAHAQLGHWKQAALDFAEAAEQEPGNYFAWGTQALAQLAGGDTSGYQRSCAAMLERFGRGEPPARIIPGDTHFWLVYTCVVAPDAVKDMTPLVALAERMDPGVPWGAALQGATLYRAGRVEAAVQWLTEASAASGVRDWHTPNNRLFLAMAHARLGHTAEAREWLVKATAWVDEWVTHPPTDRWWFRVMLSHLRREAEALLPPAGPR